MRFLSTRGGSAATFSAALLDGLAPDGGLYMPERIPRWSEQEVAGLRSLSVDDVAVAALRPYVEGEIEPAAVRAAAASALSFPLPLVEIEPDVFALELFHGPTAAFKDIGARLMARLMAALPRQTPGPVTVLVATSGDTGGAVGHAFSGLAGTRVAILYPDGGVSPTQEAQLVEFNADPAATSVRMPLRARSTIATGW